jgi:restriction system protein
MHLVGVQLPQGPVYQYKGLLFETGGNQQLKVCQDCGWWVITQFDSNYTSHDGGYLVLRRGCGTLKHLDLANIETPTEELRSYLLARYGDRFLIHPRKYEEIVGAVFADFGYRVRVTSFSGDEGIDVIILDGADNATIGIQVKRQRGNVTAEQIRSFVGALLLKGMTTGVYVTSSSYQEGAIRAVYTAHNRCGLAVHLFDAKRFYEALQITRRADYTSADDPSAPFFQSWREMDKATVVYSTAW